MQSPIRMSDASGYEGWAERVFSPETEDEVLEVLREAVRTETPVTVRGAGTGLTGSGVPRGGWVLSLDRFRMLEIKPGLARVGPAIRLVELHEAAERTGQFYPPDPTEIMASVGGTIATNASGSRSFRFGSTRRHVTGLRVARMDGTVRWYRRGDAIDFAVPAVAQPSTTKSTAGYRLWPGMDWVDLFCGSEGTLGVVLEAELNLLPLPRERISGVIFYPDDEDALTAVRAWRSEPTLRMLEYADRRSLEMLRSRYPEIPDEAQAALLIEAEGGDVTAWRAQVHASRALREASWFTLDSEDRERFRGFRHALPELVLETLRSRGFMSMGTDFAVPVERDREMLAYYRERLEAKLPGSYVVYGHLGDAHLHVNMLPRSDQEVEIASLLLHDFAEHALQLGGTVSGEHGLGKRKAGLLGLQFRPEEVEAMRQVKRRLDPLWLLGQGTLFEDLSGHQSC